MVTKSLSVTVVVPAPTVALGAAHSVVAAVVESGMGVWHEGSVDD